MFAFCEWFFFFFFWPEVFVLLPCVAVFTFPIIETFYYLACPHPKSGTLYIAVLQSIVITVPFFQAMWEVDFGPQLRHSYFQP